MKFQSLFLPFFLLIMSCDAYAQQWGSSGIPTSTEDGIINMSITGDPSTWRVLQGGTANGGLSIITNTSGTNGPCLSMHGSSLPLVGTENRAGSIYYLAYQDAGTGSIGHRFITFSNTGTPLYQTNMIIGNDGRTIIGSDVDYSFISAGDNLTVRDQLGLWPSGTSAGNVRINGNTNVGSLTLNANSTAANGASIQLRGHNIDGRIEYTSSYSGSGIGHQFLNYDGSYHSNSIITNDGRMIVGRDMTVAYAATGDVLTVRDQIGLFPSWTSAAVTRINGNTTSGAFLLNSNTSQTDGPSIGMYGAPGGGQIKYVSYDHGGTPWLGHQFMSYDGSAFHNNVVIRNDGHMIVGNDMDFSYAASGDVLTVRDQIGLFPSWTSAGVTKINGNTTSGAFLLNSNTSQTDGPSIGMYGAPGGGQIKYVSYDHGGTPWLGHQFMSYDGSAFHNNVVIRNDGHMIVGNDMDFSYAASGDVLTVRDQIGLFPSWTSAGVTKINGNTSTGAFMLHGNTKTSDGPSIGLYGAPGGGAIKYTSFGTTWYGHIFQNCDNTGETPVYNERMGIRNDGKVVIGKDLLGSGPFPDGYLLFVEKGILTEHVKVAIRSTSYWSDFVFSKNYDLMPLSEVEAYIKVNKHLPEIPSAHEVVKEGLDLGSMDAKLLQKVEELTLYVIEQQKRIEALEKQLEK